MKATSHYSGLKCSLSSAHFKAKLKYHPQVPAVEPAVRFQWLSRDGKSRIPGKISSQVTDLSCKHKRVSIGKKTSFFNQRLFGQQFRGKGCYGFMPDCGTERGCRVSLGFFARKVVREVRNVGAFRRFLRLPGQSWQEAWEWRFQALRSRAVNSCIHACIICK